MPHNEYTIERDSNFISGFGRATRIVTIHDLAPPAVRGEWFILLDGRNPLFDMGSVEVDMHGSGVNHRKLTNLLKNEADIHISSLLDEHISKTGNPMVLSYQHNWDIIGESELIDLWLPGRHKTAFEKIINDTKCDPLKSILVDVMRYPLLNL